MEEELSSRMKRAGATAREPVDDSTSDAGDESVNNERKEEQLWKVDTDRGRGGEGGHFPCLRRQ